MTAFSVLALFPRELRLQQNEAVIAAMLFLGTAGMIGLALVGAAVARFTGRRRLARLAAGTALAVGGAYAMLLFGAAALSHERTYEGVAGATPLWTTPLRPGESFTKDVVFDVPADIESPRLLVLEPFFPTPLLVFHENSPGHKKTYLSLSI